MHSIVLVYDKYTKQVCVWSVIDIYYILELYKQSS